VTVVHNFVGAEVMRHLTVADIQTYYVIAGNEPVLVHNNDKFFCEAKAEVAQLREQEGLLTPDAEDAIYAEQEAAEISKAKRKKNTRGRLDIVNATFHGGSGVNPYAETYPGKGHHPTAVSFKQHAEGDLFT
jgi:hypothetical protein